ncbi:hypothetical protein BG011_009813 [Mortierella polycephala]|uniref:Uncharacterized protein n=1 Tax=Mortierella polycephala TaxID=41804 RepID=A0A9P6PNK0_9FUNG|nr:hypothetical protein BG011_009813 [Mortierella polycephala]
MAALSISITTLRYIILFSCIGAFGFDMYFVHVYILYPTVVFSWKFTIQTSMAGVLALIMINSEILYRIQVYRRNYRERHFRHDFGEHNPYLESHIVPEAATSATTTTTTATSTPMASPHDNKRAPKIRVSRSYCVRFWSLIRFLVVWCVCAALFRVTVSSFRYQSRQVFEVPFERTSGVTGDYWDWEHHSRYDPRDLFDCPDVDWDYLPSTLCNFDQSTMILAAVAGLLAVFEALMTLILENRDPELPKMLIKTSAGTDTVRHPVEAIDQAELGHSQVIAAHMPQSPMEMHPYAVYQSPPPPPAKSAIMAHIPDSNISERSLPPLPPRETDKVAMAIPVYEEGDSANVLASDDKKKKEVMRDNEEEPLPVLPIEEDDNQAGPSHSYPADVKHTNGKY